MVKAVDDVTFSLNRGDVLVIAGESGSGKSTLLRIICGLENSDSGKVIFNGIDLEEIPPEKRGIGMVFQNLALFPHLNVHDNLKFGLPLNSSIARIPEILELVGLKNFGQRKIQNLSGGESQRVALARSLIAEPKMILLDEPFSSLDKNHRDQLVLQVRSILKKAQVTSILVTHDETEADSFADVVGIINNKQLSFK
jgi:iron(III) transport system ATP-binding protein